jgi:hypothetical protein
MKNLLLTLLLFPVLAFGQVSTITVCDEDTVPITDFILPTLRPVILCPFEVGFVFWWDMTTGGGGSGPYFHSMSPFDDGAYHLGVDDSHILEPGKPWCFICVEGTDYNVVADAWGVADSTGGFTPVVNCDLVPDYEYVQGWPDRFNFDEAAHDAIGGSWSLTLSNSPTFAAPYIYKTPPFSFYPIYNTSTSSAPWVPYTKLRVRYTFPNGTQCTDEYEWPALRTGSVIGLDGQVKDRKGWYIEDRKLKIGQ